jgi:hypothetical protein
MTPLDLLTAVVGVIAGGTFLAVVLICVVISLVD